MPETERRLNELEGKVREYGVLLDRLDEDIYNHGKDGMKTVLTQFIAEQRAHRATRDEEDKNFRDWIKLTLTIIGVIIALFEVLHTYESYSTGRLRFPGQKSAIYAQAANQVTSLPNEYRSTQ